MLEAIVRVIVAMGVGFGVGILLIVIHEAFSSP